MSVEVASKLDRIDELLESAYHSADLGNVQDILSETIYVLLSQQTREATYQRVFSGLRRAYPTWLGVLRSTDARLEQLLKPAGFQVRRTRQLKALLEAVAAANRERRIGPYGRPISDLTLEFLHDLDDKQAEQFLDRLPGVGPKTARCVLTYSMARPAFPVDTHVHRILTRLDLVASRGRKADHNPYQAIVPEHMRKRLHINLVHHGRTVCRTQAERCGDCVLISFCPRGQRRVATAIDRRPAVIDLFSGVGGLALGFEKVGFRVAVAVESDRNAAQTYRLNHPGVPVVESRIGSHTTARVLRRHTRFAREIVGVIAGPPCQGYSVAGNRWADDPRNLLYRHVARLASELNAKFVVIENVPGARSVQGVEFAKRIEQVLRRRAFIVSRWLLNARDFGVPQRRSRLVFFAATQKALAKADTPIPSHSYTRDRASPRPRTPTVLQQLQGLPRVQSGVVAERLKRRGVYFHNVSTMRHSRRVIQKIARIPRGDGPLSYRRLRYDVAYTLVAGHRAMPVHPFLDRTINVREAARIQGFPDTYVFLGKRGTQPLQVANAVPPPLAAAVARPIRRQLARLSLRRRRRSAPTPQMSGPNGED